MDLSVTPKDEIWFLRVPPHFNWPLPSTHAPYCHLRPARLYNIFPHYLTNDTRFSGGKKDVEYKMCFDFSITLVSNTAPVFLFLAFWQN
jgi:hypothetical protein